MLLRVRNFLPLGLAFISTPPSIGLAISSIIILAIPPGLIIEKILSKLDSISLKVSINVAFFFCSISSIAFIIWPLSFSSKSILSLTSWYSSSTILKTSKAFRLTLPNCSNFFSSMNISCSISFGAFLESFKSKSLYSCICISRPSIFDFISAINNL